MSNKHEAQLRLMGVSLGFASIFPNQTSEQIKHGPTGCVRRDVR